MKKEKGFPIINIWEGIYKSFQEARVHDDAFNDIHWASSSLAKLKNLQTNEADYYSKNPNQDSLLPILVATLSSSNRKVNILDFGGGFGISYMQTVQSTPHANNIKFIVVEKSEVCNKGRKFFKKK